MEVQELGMNIGKETIEKKKSMEPNMKVCPRKWVPPIGKKQ